MQEEDRKVEEKEILKCVFTTNENFCFGSPMTKIFRRIKSKLKI